MTQSFTSLIKSSGQSSKIELTSTQSWLQEYPGLTEDIKNILWVIKATERSFALVTKTDAILSFTVPGNISELNIQQLPILSLNGDTTPEEFIYERFEVAADGIYFLLKDLDGVINFSHAQYQVDTQNPDGYYTVVTLGTAESKFEDLLNSIQSINAFNKFLIKSDLEELLIPEVTCQLTCKAQYLNYDSVMLTCAPTYNGEAEYMAYIVNDVVVRIADSTKNTSLIIPISSSTIVKAIPVDDIKDVENLLPCNDNDSLIYASDVDWCDSTGMLQIYKLQSSESGDTLRKINEVELGQRITNEIPWDKLFYVTAQTSVDTHEDIEIVAKDESIYVPIPDDNMQYLTVAYALQEDGSYKVASAFVGTGPVTIKLEYTGIYSILIVQLPQQLKLSLYEQLVAGSGRVVWLDSEDVIRLSPEFGPDNYCCALNSPVLKDLTQLLQPLINLSWRKTYFYKNLSKLAQLWQCYYSIVEQLLCMSCGNCEKSADVAELERKRDLIWMYLNVINYAKNSKQFMKMKKYIDQMENCNVICQNLTKNSTCGCSR